MTGTAGQSHCYSNVTILFVIADEISTGITKDIHVPPKNIGDAKTAEKVLTLSLKYMYCGNL